MQIRSTQRNGIEQHLIDEFHHRVVGGFIGQCFDVFFFLFLVFFYCEIDVRIAHQFFHGGFGTGEKFVNSNLQLVVIANDSVHGHGGREFNALDGLRVGGIRQGDHDVATSNPEGQYSMLHDHIFFQEVGVEHRRIQGRDIKVRYTELLG